MANPKGADGKPMENHHIARQDGETVPLMKEVHNIVHEQERQAVRNVMQQDGLKGIRNI